MQVLERTLPGCARQKGYMKSEKESCLETSKALREWIESTDKTQPEIEKRVDKFYNIGLITPAHLKQLDAQIMRKFPQG